MFYVIESNEDTLLKDLEQAGAIKIIHANVHEKPNYIRHPNAFNAEELPQTPHDYCILSLFELFNALQNERGSREIDEENNGYVYDAGGTYAAAKYSVYGIANSTKRPRYTASNSENLKILSAAPQIYKHVPCDSDNFVFGGPLNYVHQENGECYFTWWNERGRYKGSCAKDYWDDYVPNNIMILVVRN